MPKKIRNLVNTNFFHVLVQGNNKEYIFTSNKEMKKYEKLLFKFKSEYDLKIIAYCIMGNHAHILVEATEIQKLSEFMHKINTIFAIYYNKKYEHVGHVFRSRFKSQEIYTKEYLYNCINYIHKNPVKAGICKSENEYEFSSFKKYGKFNDFLLSLYNQDKIFIGTEKEQKQQAIELIEFFLAFKNIKREDLLKKDEYLKEILFILSKKNNISALEIARTLGVGRETIRKKIKEL